jgi:serine/threonine protein phosphatase 1
MIAIGDIHGCRAALDAVLAAVDPQPSDTIVTLGDYVGRGPDSQGVINRLIELGRECRSICLLGNHDQMFLEALTDQPSRNARTLRAWLQMGGGVTLASYGFRPVANRQITRDDLAIVPAEHRQFFAQCRPYYETDTHIFVHANYDRGLPMNRQPDHVLRWESLRDGLPGPHISGKRAIVGHSSQKSGEILDLGYLVCIDTYCYGGGWLTALDVESGHVWQVDRQGTPRSA